MAINKNPNGLENYISNNKENSIREYIIGLDNKINIDNYSNNQLKEYIEANYNISFSRNKSIGKDYVNYNTFRKITGEVKTKKKIYAEIQRLFLEKKDQQRAKTYEDIKKILGDIGLSKGMEYLWKTAEELEELNRQETATKKLTDILEGYSILVNNNNLVEIMPVSAEDFKEIYKLNKHPKNKAHSKDKQFIYTDGKRMVTGYPDHDGNLRDSEKVCLCNESNFYEIIQNFKTLNTYLKYDGKTIINALLKTRELALAGNININFEELLKNQ
jgi:hypothetical protein